MEPGRKWNMMEIGTFICQTSGIQTFYKVFTLRAKLTSV